MLEKAYRSWPAIVRFYLPFSDHFTFLIGHYMTIKFFHFYQGTRHKKIEIHIAFAFLKIFKHHSSLGV